MLPDLLANASALGRLFLKHSLSLACFELGGLKNQSDSLSHFMYKPPASKFAFVIEAFARRGKL
ncbi:hypothetical protein C0Z16_23055 [Paraburkholderia rhynchosiae]|uniref:Uncharacterized protein n=1 Tax=Paraburkholderia rhynchosiae TaxID=487049 RepID=A0ABX4V003_9BURK|nr:hypothetical protein C0Z16_23055 [Paraburkholderia rhynchosiae]